MVNKLPKGEKSQSNNSISLRKSFCFLMPIIAVFLSFFLMETVTEDAPKRLRNQRCRPTYAIGNTGLYTTEFEVSKWDTLDEDIEVQDLEIPFKSEYNIIATYAKTFTSGEYVETVHEHFITKDLEWKEYIRVIGRYHTHPWESRPVQSREYTWYSKLTVYQPINRDNISKDSLAKKIGESFAEMDKSFSSKSGNAGHWNFVSLAQLPDYVSLLKRPNPGYAHINYQKPYSNSVIYYDGLVYVFNVKSPIRCAANAEDLLATITAYDWGETVEKYNKSVENRYFALLSAMLILGLLCLFFVPWKKNKPYNIQCKKLFIYAFVVFMVNMLIVFKQSTIGFYGDISDKLIWSWIMYLSLVSYLLCTWGLAYLVYCAKKEYKADYLMPSFIQGWLKKRVYEKEYKAIILVVLYPTLLCCILPIIGGGFLCLYSMPLIIILWISILIRKANSWIDNEKTEDLIQYTFKDYYLVLDLDKKATEDEVDKAFNRAKAKLETVGMFGFSADDINEAYLVLTSNRIRSLYDMEYERFENTIDKSKYKINNQTLCHALEQIKPKSKKTRKTARNIMRVSIGILLAVYTLTFLGWYISSGNAKIDMKEIFSEKTSKHHYYPY